MNKFIRFALRCLPAVFCMILIFSLSAHTAAESSDVSGGLIKTIAGILSPGFDQMTSAEQNTVVEQWQFFVRKCAHFSIYALLGILCVFPVSVYYRGRSAALFSLCIAWLYAVSDELHQYFVPGRSCEIRDVLIDWSGAALGVGIVMLIGLLSKRNKQK